MVSENDQLSQIRNEVETVFGHFRLFLYISYNTTVLKNIILKSIHVRFEHRLK